MVMYMSLGDEWERELKKRSTSGIHRSKSDIEDHATIKTNGGTWHSYKDGTEIKYSSPLRGLLKHLVGLKRKKK